MFGPQTTLFNLFDFKIKIDLSWIFIALLVAWSLASGYFPAVYEGLPQATYWSMGIVGAIGLFFSIVFHELAHSLVARRYGIMIRGITLFIFGGVAEMETEPKNARGEFMMAIAGPLSSLFLGVVFALLSSAGQQLNAPAALYGILSYLAFFNIIIAVFNMVPAFPLDGGRVLRAALWHKSGDIRWATQIASNAGIGFGYILMALGILNFVSGNFLVGLWWFLIGIFVQNAAAAHFQRLRMRRVLKGQTVAQFMTADPVTVSPDIKLDALVENYVYKTHHKVYPVLEGNRLVGRITTGDIKEVGQDQWAVTYVGDVMKPCSQDNMIEADTDAMNALDRIQRTRNGRLIVTRDGVLVGIISLKDLLELLTLKLDLEETE